MPSTCCCVPKYSNRGGHVFPKNEKLRKKWIKANRKIQTRTNFSIGNLQRVVLCVKYTSKNPTTYQKQHVVSLVYF